MISFFLTKCLLSDLSRSSSHHAFLLPEYVQNWIPGDTISIQGDSKGHAQTARVIMESKDCIGTGGQKRDCDDAIASRP